MELTTRELALAARISNQAVRDYEAAGLLPSVPRRENGYRAFSAMHLAALLVIRALKEAGYTRTDTVIVMGTIHRGALSDVLLLLDDHHGALRDRRLALVQAGQDHPIVHWDTEVVGQEMTLSIGDAARRLGVRPSALRFWELQEVIQVGRNPANGYRRFREADLERIATVQRMRTLGVPWDAIRDALKANRVGGGMGQMETTEILRGIDHQSWLNARATALVSFYNAAYKDAGRDIENDLLRPFLDSLVTMRSPDILK